MARQLLFLQLGVGYPISFAAAPDGVLTAYRAGLDKDLAVFGISGEKNLANYWSIGGSAVYERGAHDHTTTAAVFLKKVW